jgi:hypothetical protein
VLKPDGIPLSFLEQARWKKRVFWNRHIRCLDLGYIGQVSAIEFSTSQQSEGNSNQLDFTIGLISFGYKAMFYNKVMPQYLPRKRGEIVQVQNQNKLYAAYM